MILKKFKGIYYLSDGFTSDEHWFSILKKSANNLNEIIFNAKYFDSTFFDWYFDYEENFSGLLKQFRHLSLFSVSLHFLRCVRSCEKVFGLPPHCKLCSRVRDFDFVSRDTYEDLMITSYGSLLGLSFHERIDLDVFLSNADDYFIFFITPNKNFLFFQNFTYTQDIFAAFSSILIRTYLNICFGFFLLPGFKLN